MIIILILFILLLSIMIRQCLARNCGWGRKCLLTNIGNQTRFFSCTSSNHCSKDWLHNRTICCQIKAITSCRLTLRGAFGSWIDPLSDRWCSMTRIWCFWIIFCQYSIVRRLACCRRQHVWRQSFFRTDLWSIDFFILPSYPSYLSWTAPQVSALTSSPSCWP